MPVEKYEPTEADRKAEKQREERARTRKWLRALEADKCPKCGNDSGLVLDVEGFELDTVNLIAWLKVNCDACGEEFDVWFAPVGIE